MLGLYITTISISKINSKISVIDSVKNLLRWKSLNKIESYYFFFKISIDFSCLKYNGNSLLTNRVVDAKLLSPRVLKCVLLHFSKFNDEDLRYLNGV